MLDPHIVQALTEVDKSGTGSRGVVAAIRDSRGPVAETLDRRLLVVDDDEAVRQIVAELLKGSRCGLALQALSRAFDEVNTELTALYDRAASGDAASDANKARLGHLWMLRQDLAGYILLGDPAARMSVAPKRAYQTGSATTNSDGANLASVLGFVPKP